MLGWGLLLESNCGLDPTRFADPCAIPTPMTNPQSNLDEVDQLLLNAELRDALEPYLDESVDLVNVRHLPTEKENEFLESMLAWERAPVLPISRWFEPELVLPPPDDLDADQLHRLLWQTLERLCEQRVVVEYTDHLTDRQLYGLIRRDILPSLEKRIEQPKNYLHWHCLDADENPEIWLRYYATPDERRRWVEENSQELPPAEPPPHPRKMPRRPAGN